MNLSSTAAPTLAESDVLVVGAGIVGLAHAAEAARRGLSVTVIDRDRKAVGASVRNFGHCCVTAQSGDLLDLALSARERWLDYSARAGFFATDAGALTVARTAAELSVLDELAESREPGQVRRLDAAGTREMLSVPGDAAILGGAVMRDDLRVDPRQAAGALAGWLERECGVRFLWNTSYLGAEGRFARTSRGLVRAEQTYVCVGHDLDYLYPDVAVERGIRRCGLQMAMVEAPAGLDLKPAVLTGTSMLRYPAFAETTAAEELRRETQEVSPGLLDIDANIMFTQRPDGSVIVGDSHRYGETMDPFLAEQTSELLLAEVARVLGVERLRVLQRWQGIYAHSTLAPYAIAAIEPNVTAVSVTSGVGMTISFGLARRVLDGIAPDAGDPLPSSSALAG